MARSLSSWSLRERYTPEMRGDNRHGAVEPVPSTGYYVNFAISTKISPTANVGIVRVPTDKWDVKSFWDTPHIIHKIK